MGDYIIKPRVIEMNAFSVSYGPIKNAPFKIRIEYTKPQEFHDFEIGDILDDRRNYRREKFGDSPKPNPPNESEEI